MAQPGVWLLLVGIDSYPAGITQLNGAVNDVEEIEMRLKQYYGAATVIKLLSSTGGQLDRNTCPGDEDLRPTWDNFNSRLKYIMRQASAGDIVWIHYSGHGVLLSTLNSQLIYQESYGTDAALVLLQPGGRQGIRYLRGIELAPLLDDMVHKGLKLTVILDSCHSGSISRGEDSTIRSIPWNADVDSEFPPRVPQLPRPSIFRKHVFRDAVSTSHWFLYPKNWALLAACGPHEVAKEIRVTDAKRFRGAFSYSICKALDSYVPNEKQEITHDLVHRHASATMTKVTGQHPVLIGTEKTTLWGTEAVRLDTRAFFEITKVLSDQEVWLNTGHVHGSGTGDEYGVYSQTEPKEFITRITIIDVEAVHSIARHIPSEVGGFQIEVGHSATLIKLGRPRAVVKLFSGADSSWNKKIEESMWLQYLAPGERVPVDVSCFSVAERDGHQYNIHNVKEDIVPSIPHISSSNPHVGDQLLTILDHLAKYTFVRNLDNRCVNSLNSSDFIIRVRGQSDDLDPRHFDGSCIVPHDSKVDIEFQNFTRKVLYLTILNLTPLRKIKRLYPRDKECQIVMPQDLQNILPKGTSDIVPPTAIRLQPRMTVPKRLIGQQQGSVSAEDLLKFIVSTCPIRGTKSMELPDLWDAVEGKPAAVRSDDDAFGVTIQESLVHVSDDFKQEAQETTIKWACQNVTILTVIEASQQNATTGQTGPTVSI